MRFNIWIVEAEQHANKSVFIYECFSAGQQVQESTGQHSTMWGDIRVFISLVDVQCKCVCQLMLQKHWWYYVMNWLNLFQYHWQRRPLGPYCALGCHHSPLVADYWPSLGINVLYCLEHMHPMAVMTNHKLRTRECLHIMNMKIVEHRLLL